MLDVHFSFFIVFKPEYHYLGITAADSANDLIQNPRWTRQVLSWRIINRRWTCWVSSINEQFQIQFTHLTSKFTRRGTVAMKCTELFVACSSFCGIKINHVSICSIKKSIFNPFIEGFFPKTIQLKRSLEFEYNWIQHVGGDKTPKFRRTSFCTVFG